jgi:hypothetical protein
MTPPRRHDVSQLFTRMNTEAAPTLYSLQPFTPDPDALYPIDTAARLAQMPRHIVLVCCRRGMVTPHIDPDFGGLSFSHEDIRTLQQIEYLRSVCGVNLAGIQIIRQLMVELEELRAFGSG